MLFFEPIEDYATIPPAITETVKALAKRGFSHSFADDLELINLGRAHPLIEKDGKFIYDGAVVGYLRAIQPAKPNWI